MLFLLPEDTSSGARLTWSTSLLVPTTLDQSCLLDRELINQRGQLGAARFRCENAACTSVTFAEQVVGLTTPHSCYTPLLHGMLTQIGPALAGRAGARVAALPEPETGEVEVLGVDHFAFRKGRHHGPVLIDMATHHPLHLYNGREGDDLAAWHQATPR
ncbi:hypothetical protein ACIQZB_25475 [Streptomyces sp. NPDC097727]|uniref:hypothetical protein n=1 Tax=Streptomyces sp. NPDC097727 TaxID=3366092 RepID=UPI0037FD1658